MIRIVVRAVLVCVFVAQGPVHGQEEFASFLTDAAAPGMQTGLGPTAPTNWNDPIEQEVVRTTLGCGGIPMIEWVKSNSNSFPGATEQHFYENGYWKALSEFAFDSGTGAVTAYRVYRDTSDPYQNPWRKGFGRFPESIPSNRRWVVQTIGPYVEEYWGINPALYDGKPTPACDAVWNLPMTGSVASMLSRYIPKTRSQAFVYDCRFNPCLPDPVPVDIFEHVEYWDNGAGGYNRETYQFARWVDPRSSTGEVRGLGLYSWARQGLVWGQSCVNQECIGYNNHVVPAANVTIPCSTCPDP